MLTSYHELIPLLLVSDMDSKHHTIAVEALEIDSIVLAA